MAEWGIDLRAAGARPGKLEDAAVEASDVVITMGCGDACPSTRAGATRTGRSTARPVRA